MTDRWAFSDLHSLRERFFDDTPQPADVLGWLLAEHRFAEYIASGVEQASPHWDDFSMDNELRDRRNSGTVAAIYHPITRAHVALHDPAAVLARVVAERAILEACENVLSGWHYGESKELAHDVIVGLAAGWGWTEAS